ncbi:MAG: cell division protein ZapA [Xanthomonadaceae bacterium]|nr:cell division protein ZapA [Xanthomonadaceae bacterium]
MELQILGQKLPIRTDENDELAISVMRIAQARIEAAEEKVAHSKLATTPSHVLTMALLEVTEEYVKAKQRFEEFKADTEIKLDRLMSQVNALHSKKKK